MEQQRLEGRANQYVVGDKETDGGAITFAHMV